MKRWELFFLSSRSKDYTVILGLLVDVLGGCHLRKMENILTNEVSHRLILWWTSNPIRPCRRGLLCGGEYGLTLKPYSLETTACSDVGFFLKETERTYHFRKGYRGKPHGRNINRRANGRKKIYLIYKGNLPPVKQDLKVAYSQTF